MAPPFTTARPLFGLLITALALAPLACGDEPRDQPTQVAPAGLSYTPSSAALVLGVPFSATAMLSTPGSPPPSFSVNPSLPAGLMLNGSNGLISGTPTALADEAGYTVTAANTAGSTQARITLSVVAAGLAPSDLAYPTPTALYPVGVAIAPNTPTVTGTAPIAFTIAPALPTGLSLDAATGTIAGTPTAPSPATPYTVTATNAFGQTTTTLSISVLPAVVSPMTETIGPEGGRVELADGAVVEVGPGALLTPTDITVTRLETPAPDGYLAYSSVYRFAPAGLSFWPSAEVRLPFSGDADRAVLFWSRPGGDGFELLRGWVEDGYFGAYVAHFSEGFVGDGDGSCFGEDPTPWCGRDADCVDQRCVRSDSGEPCADCAGVCRPFGTDTDACGACASACLERDTALCEEGTCELGDGAPNGGYANWPLPGSPGNAPDYALNETLDLVTDLVTGLQWQRGQSNSDLTWSEAKTYCEGLVIQSFSDWRLPSRVELASLHGHYDPFWPAGFFANDQNAFWTSSPGPDYTAWAISFFDSGSSYWDTETPHKVRCVRGGTQLTTTPFVDRGDGTVEDVVTALLWQQRPSPDPMTQASATTYCSGLSLGGRTGWRVPTILELQSLVDERRFLPAIDPHFFPGTASVAHWSSTLSFGYAWGVDFREGSTHRREIAGSTRRVRCVWTAPAATPTPSSYVRHVYTGSTVSINPISESCRLELRYPLNQETIAPSGSGFSRRIADFEFSLEAGTRATASIPLDRLYFHSGPTQKLLFLETINLPNLERRYVQFRHFWPSTGIDASTHPPDSVPPLEAPSSAMVRLFGWRTVDGIVDYFNKHCVLTAVSSALED